MYHFYVMPVIFGAVPGLGILLAAVAEKNVWARRMAFAVVGIFALAQAGLTAATIRDQYLDGNIGRFNAPLDFYLSAVQEWRDAGNGKELIFLTETQEGKRGPDLHVRYWRVLSEGYTARA